MPPPAPAQAGASAGGKLTALVVDTHPERGPRLRELLSSRGWRLLDQDAPRTVLNWALVERIVDVVLLDPRWPRAAQLRQNLSAEPGTAALPIVRLDDLSAEQVVERATAAATEKREQD